MSVKDFTLDILGSSFSIRVDEDPAYLNEILNQYRSAVEKTREMFNLKDPLVTAVLTGFLLSDELHKKKSPNNLSAAEQEDAQKAEELALSIIARIDRVLEDEAAGKV